MSLNVYNSKGADVLEQVLHTDVSNEHFVFEIKVKLTNSRKSVSPVSATYRVYSV